MSFCGFAATVTYPSNYNFCIKGQTAHPRQNQSTAMSSTQGGIISLNFGGCGVRLGASTTRLYAEDFGIGMDGSIASNRMKEGYYYDVFFSEQKGSSDQDNKKFQSRSLYFDSDPDSLDSITGS